jgi:CheY-like chemotaxis protein
LGKGTTVELWLPIAAGETAVVSQTIGVGVTPTATRGESVLVIEDDRDVRRFIVECLVNLGYQVVEADNGYVGLEQLKRETPDLLIVDFAMPGINGAEVATIARKNAATLPIIFVTGYADMDAVERVPDPKHLLRKPFDVSGLSDVVKEALLSAVRRTSAAATPFQTSL